MRSRSQIGPVSPQTSSSESGPDVEPAECQTDGNRCSASLLLNRPRRQRTDESRILLALNSHPQSPSGLKPVQNQAASDGERTQCRTSLGLKMLMSKCFIFVM